MVTLLLTWATSASCLSLYGPLVTFCLRVACHQTASLWSLLVSGMIPQDRGWRFCIAEGTKPDGLCGPFHLLFQGSGFQTPEIGDSWMDSPVGASTVLSPAQRSVHF